jgi:cytochrome bd ubiquinol oxidase subunit I
MPIMTDLIAARSQMAMSLGFHIVFASLGIAMPLLISLTEWRWLRTGDGRYLQLAKRWAKGTAVLFAIGAVSGTVLSFQLGLLWPHFMERAGPLIGPLFALEGFAFFTESIFLGIYLYGWTRISPRAHWYAGLMVGASGIASAAFVVAANAWMNAPTGFTLEGDRFTQAEPLATLLHPMAWHEIIHMLLAAFTATGFLVAGIHAYFLLRDRNSFFHRKALLMALAVGGLPALLQPISGDLLAKTVARHQPAKLAAMEALFRTQASAPFVLGGVPDSTTQTVPYALVIPAGLSILLHSDPSAVVPGLDGIPRADWPPVTVVHLAFQVMVGCGFVLAALALWSGWRWWRNQELEKDSRLLQALLCAAPLGFVAIEAGWVVTEVGRQPWVIYHIMRTTEAVTLMPGLWVPMLTFGLLYCLLAGVVTWALWRHIAATDVKEMSI